VISGDNISVTSGSNEDIDLIKDILYSHNFESFHTGLQGTDGITLSHEHSGSTSLHAHGRALSDIAETTDKDLLTGNHDIGGSVESIRERVSATVVVIELALGDRVIHIDARA
jgi:hypothetical protein